MDSELNTVYSRWFDGTDHQIELENGGLYSIELTLPSGKIFRRTSMFDNHSTPVVQFNIALESPDKASEWAYFSRKLAKPVDQYVEAFSTRSILHVSLVHDWRAAGRSDQGLYSEPTGKLDWGLNWAGTDPVNSNVLSVETVILERSFQQSPYNFNVNTVDGNAILQLSGPAVDLKIVHLPPRSSVKCLIKRSDRPVAEDHPYDVTIATDNQSADIILQLMSRNDINEAEALIGYPQIAEDLLYNKVEDPTSAAVGGYFLLRIGDLEKLHNWPTNLANWFPWFPDGCIIAAWQILKEAAKRNVAPDLNAVADLLFRSTDRGRPVYSEGIKLLYEGFRLLSYNTGQLSEVNNYLLSNKAGLVNQLYADVDVSSPYLTIVRSVDPINLDSPFASLASGTSSLTTGARVARQTNLWTPHDGLTTNMSAAKKINIKPKELGASG
ncbi:hypothetical protein [Dawidia soli]|uniref:Uncharacterized protein n=1 Tax=Dawidia soli TaxID=2782352 RepID=A0AAP2D8F6_9BACT|nr:hypothetical protein [Dawidia soli]MBT1687391.1 hypothetical protein [Dawidia soli]